jgi:hypothetical protein
MKAEQGVRYPDIDALSITLLSSRKTLQTLVFQFQSRRDSSNCPSNNKAGVI